MIEEEKKSDQTIDIVSQAYLFYLIFVQNREGNGNDPLHN